MIETETDEIDGMERAKRRGEQVRTAKREQVMRGHVLDILEAAGSRYLGAWDHSLEINHMRDGYLDATLYDERTEEQVATVRISVEVTSC